MKRINYILAITVLLVFISGCSSQETIKSIFHKKYSIGQFKSMFSDSANKQNIKGTDLEIDAFRDITPKDLYRETGAQIFKNGKTAQAYLLYEGKIYMLGLSFGGYGIVDIVTCDFDSNGKKELLYSYSWGSGITRSCIGYFDLLQRKEEVLNITEGQPLGYIKEDLIFKKVSDNKIEVYTAKIKVEGGDFSKLSIEKDKQFGTIKVIENKPVFEGENKK